MQMSHDGGMVTVHHIYQFSSTLNRLRWSEVPGSNSAEVDGFFSERKNHEYDFLRKGSKAVGPVSYIYGT